MPDKPYLKSRGWNKCPFCQSTAPDHPVPNEHGVDLDSRPNMPLVMRVGVGDVYEFKELAGAMALAISSARFMLRDRFPNKQFDFVPYMHRSRKSASYENRWPEESVCFEYIIIER